MANGETVRRRVFVDFMYAIVVGSALPLVNDKHLDFRDPVLYGLLFLIAIVLEDYFLYETQIARFQDEKTKIMPGLVFEMSVLICWYLTAVAIPDHPIWFLYSFPSFFALKFISGLVAAKSLRGWQTLRNVAFFLPIAVSMWILHCKVPTKIDAFVIIPLSITWLVMLIIWWGVTYCKTKLLDPRPVESPGFYF